jgi:hypothetical protein
MVLPTLIHPIWITIQRADKAATVYDDDVREPIRSVKREEVLIQAQVTWRQVADPRFEAYGLAEDVRGYLLFRVTDLAAKPYTPARGDMITKLGTRDTQLFLLQSSDAGHYPDQNGASLVRWYWGERRPSAQQPSS